MNAKYDVRLVTSIGTKGGKIFLIKNGKDVSGTFFVINEENKFTGFETEDGLLEIDGVIKTKYKTVNYHATGKADDEKIALSIKTKNDKYTLYGIREEE